MRRAPPCCSAAGEVLLFLAAAWTSCAGGVRPQSPWVLRQLVHALHPGGSDSGSSSGSASENLETCVPLKNDGTSSSVNVAIGSPTSAGTEQGPFRLVADTGSNALIVQSCYCGNMGFCTTSADTRCFVGTGKSSTFSVFTEHGWEVPAEGQEAPEALMRQISFGSGDIKGIIAKDRVCAGALCTMMDDGFLSMVQAQLDIAGPTIEGIFGLGLPESHSHRLTSQAGVTPANVPQTTSFLEQANIQRFSICFNEHSDGVLRMRTPQRADALGSFGVMHWGVGIDRISVIAPPAGNPAAAPGPHIHLPMEICSPSSMGAGQETPCGAIPDSGTTLITGPEHHLRVIQASLCDAWPRCSNSLSHTASQVGDQIAAAKSDAFDRTLLHCADWFGEGGGADEMPVLSFRFTGNNGRRKDIFFTGWAYTYQTMQEETRVEYADTAVGRVPVTTGTGNFTRVCMSAFDKMVYDTERNGPIFIMGTPLFYDYVVDYDLGTETPEVAFTSVAESPCGSCSSLPGGSHVELDSGGQRQRQRLRRMDGPARKPSSIDASKRYF